MKRKQGELRSYKCSLDGEHWVNFAATSYGKAKSQFLIYLDDCYPDCYLSIQCRLDGDLYTSESFKENAEYRDIPFAYRGMVVETDSGKGVIVRFNSSANLDVLFTTGKYKDKVVSCHPNWHITYFDKSGYIIKMFND